MTTHDRRSISFSQAEGLTPLPGPLALGEFESEARALLWAVIYQAITASPRRDEVTGWDYWLEDAWHIAMRERHVRHEHRPIDEYSPDLSQSVQWFKNTVFNWRVPYLFDLLTYIMRHKNLSHLENDFRAVFSESRVAYRIEDATIFPAASPQEGETIAKAFADVASSEFGGARAHLREASAAVNAGEWAAAVRESIHAVESVARVIEPKAQTLSDALKKIRGTDRLNPNLARGLEALYNYSSDEKGIRHAMVFEGAARVDRADAVYMLGACAAFVSYLIARRADGA